MNREIKEKAASYLDLILDVSHVLYVYHVASVIASHVLDLLEIDRLLADQEREEADLHFEILLILQDFPTGGDEKYCILEQIKENQ